MQVILIVVAITPIVIGHLLPIEDVLKFLLISFPRLGSTFRSMFLDFVRAFQTSLKWLNEDNQMFMLYPISNLLFSREQLSKFHFLVALNEY